MAQSFPVGLEFQLKVLITNLPPSCSKEDLQRLVDSEASNFTIEELIADETTLQSCVVALENSRDFRNVLALDGVIFKGYQIIVERFTPGQKLNGGFEVFVRHLPPRVTENDLTEIFAQFGKVKSVTLPRWYDSGKPRGFAFVRFHERVSMDKAVKCDGVLRIMDSRVSIRPNYGRTEQARPRKTDRSQRPQVSKRMKERPIGCTTVYIGNIDFDVDENGIYAEFQDCGAIKNVRIVRQQYTRRSRGFGYIEFEDGAGVTAAMKKNGTLFCDRYLRVDYADPFDPTRCKSQNFSSLSCNGAPKPAVTPVQPACDYNQFGATCSRGSGSPTPIPNAPPNHFVSNPCGFVLHPFVNKPVAGMAALAGSLNQAMQYQYQMPVYPQNVPVYAPTSPAPTPQFLATSPVPSIMNPTATQTVYNVNTGKGQGDKLQIEATFYTQGIPGWGQFIAPFAMVTQRKLDELANSDQISTTQGVVPPVQVVPVQNHKRDDAKNAGTKQDLPKRGFTADDERYLQNEMSNTTGFSSVSPPVDWQGSPTWIPSGNLSTVCDGEATIWDSTTML